MNRANPAYVPALPRDELLAVIRRACGRYGPCIDYVVETDEALRAAGIGDRQLQSVAQALRSPATELATE